MNKTLLRAVVSTALVLVLIISDTAAVVGPVPALAQQEDPEIYVIYVDGPKVIEGSFSKRLGGEPNQVILSIKNNERYWLNIEPGTTVGIEQLTANNHWAEKQIVPPGETAEWTANFKGAGACVQFQAGGISYRSLSYTTIHAILDAIPFVSVWTTEDELAIMDDFGRIASFQLAIEDIARALENGPEDRNINLFNAVQRINSHPTQLVFIESLIEWGRQHGMSDEEIVRQLAEIGLGSIPGIGGLLPIHRLLSLVGSIRQPVTTIEFRATLVGEYPLNPSFNLDVLTPSGPAGTHFEVKGDGFTPNGLGSLELERPNGTQHTILLLNVDQIGGIQGVIDSSGFGPGTYSLWAVNVSTGDRSEPVTFTIDTPYGLPDLRVTPVSVDPFLVQMGDSISVSFTVENQGNAASGPFVTWVCLSTTAHGTGSILSKVPVQSLDADASDMVTTNVIIPTFVDANEYYVTVFADAPGLGVVAEEREDNNIGTSSPNRLVINPLPLGSAITLSSPNGGEHWSVGRARAITWESHLVAGNIRIDLSRDNGSSWNTIIANTLNDGNEWWTITGPSTTNARIRVVSLEDTSISDSSDGKFTIVQMDITVTSPNGGEDWRAENSYTIAWSVTGNTAGLDYFLVKYSLNEGSSWTNIGSVSSGDRSLAWTVPYGISSSQCRIMVRAIDANGHILAADTSDANFSVTALPMLQADYPLAKLTPADTSNYWVAERRRDDIDLIVIHATEAASADSTIGWFQDPDSDVSAHYLIDPQGQIIQMVKEKDVAWHAREYNTSSIGIEHVGKTSDPNWATEAMYEASAALVDYLCEKYNIPIDRSRIRGHDELYDKSDPGQYWNWAYYLSLIKGQTASPPIPSSPGSSSSLGSAIDTLTPTFYWSAVSGVDYYGLYIRDLDTDSLVFDSQARVIQITGTSYDLPSGVLDLGKSYSWNMNSHNTAGWGSDSGVLYFQTEKIITVSSPPRNLRVTGVGDGYVNLAWDVPSDDGGSAITGYFLYRGTYSGGESFYDDTTAAWTTYSNTYVTNGQTYYYKVKAFNAIGVSSYSNEVSATPQATTTAPSPPRNLRVTSVGDGYVNLAWDVPSDDGGSAITGYFLYRDTYSGGESLYDVTTAAWTTYSNTNVTSGTTYYYKVKAVSAIGISSYSNEVSATVPQAVEATSTPTLVDVGIASKPWPGQTFLQANPGDTIYTTYSFSYSGPNMFVRLKSAVLDSNGKEIGNQLTGPLFYIINPFENPISGVSNEYKLSDEAIPGTYDVMFSIWSEDDTWQYDSVFMQDCLEIVLSE